MNLKQHAFVTEYLRFGDAQTAYRNAYKCYGSSARTIESAGNRLLKNPEVAEAIRNAQERIRSEVEEEIKQEVRRQLLTIQRKREILAMIAEGDVYIEHNYKGRDCRSCRQLIKPTFGQMLKAIDQDSKLAGHYVAQKQETPVHTAPTVPDITPPKDEMMQKHNTTVQTIATEKQITSVTLHEPPCNCDDTVYVNEMIQLFGSPVKEYKKVLIE